MPLNRRTFVGDVFSTGTNAADGVRSFNRFTAGPFKTGVKIFSGMNFYPIAGVGSDARCPAAVFYSNNLRGLSKSNPWPDLIEPERGRVLYHGDNRTIGRSATDAPGNRRLWALLDQYSDPVTRRLAPPILVFEQILHQGRSRGFRRFAGYGVPTALRVQSQAADNGAFSNLAIEIALFSLDHESDQFDWTWIDARRSPGYTVERANSLAPNAWKTWVREGNSAIEKLRRRVYSRVVRSREEQLPTTTSGRKLLDEIYRHYSPHPHGFEGLASLIAGQSIGPNHTRGWVTRRTGDGGVDFVGRVDVGHSASVVGLVLLGQAKNYRPGDGSVSGIDLARLVSRLKRGWLGAFVTTGTFTEQAQREIVDDEYPLLLIPGREIVSLIQQEMISSGLSLKELLCREDRWYDANQRALPADQILRGAEIGIQVWP